MTRHWDRHRPAHVRLWRALPPDAADLRPCAVARDASAPTPTSYYSAERLAAVRWPPPASTRYARARLAQQRRHAVVASCPARAHAPGRQCVALHLLAPVACSAADSRIRCGLYVSAFVDLTTAPPTTASPLAGGTTP